MHQLRTLCDELPEEIKPARAARVAGMLGSLAAWWLPETVLERASEFTRVPWPTPHLNADRGTCWILLANPGWPLLRPALVLPLEWQSQAQHDSGLPSALRDLADSICDELEKPDWKLHFQGDPEPQATALAALADQMDFNSGWAALAGALLVVAEGGTPIPRVWATGGWDRRRGVQPVGHLEAKLLLAANYEVEEIFVPASQGKEATLLAERLSLDLDIGILPSDALPGRALRDYLVRMKTPPLLPTGLSDTAGFAACVQHYLDLPRGTPRTRDFYMSHLLPTIIEQLRAQVRSDWPGWTPTHLLTVATGGIGLTELTVRSLGVQHVLVLHTDDLKMSQQAKEVRERLRQKGITADLCPFQAVSGEALLAQFGDAIPRFAQAIPPEHLVCDITPGTKQMSYALWRLAPAKSWLVYLKQGPMTEDGRPKPGMERIERWRVEDHLKV